MSDINAIQQEQMRRMRAEWAKLPYDERPVGMGMMVMRCMDCEFLNRHSKPVPCEECGGDNVRLDPQKYGDMKIDDDIVLKAFMGGYTREIE